MSMSKQDFIALADAIKQHHLMVSRGHGTAFTTDQLATLADFCKGQNSGFMEGRWLGYIRNENGPSGGAVKPAKS